MDIPTTSTRYNAVRFATHGEACDYATKIGVPMSFSVESIGGCFFLCRPGITRLSFIAKAEGDDS